MSDLGEERGWDRFWVAFFRHGQRRMERRGMTAIYERAKRRGDTPLSRFGKKHPVVGGIVAGLVWGGVMFIIFTVLTLFRFVLVMALLWGIGGAVFGVAMGWYWSYTRKRGHPPAF